MEGVFKFKKCKQWLLQSTVSMLCADYNRPPPPPPPRKFQR